MPNSFTASSNTIVIDTPISNLAALKAFLPSGFENALRVRKIRWVGMSAGNTVKITDLDGKVMWASEAPSADADIESAFFCWWKKGFLVPTLDGGTLYIELE